MKWVSTIKWDRVKSDESGYILILSLFVMIIATIVGMGLVVVGMNEFTLSNRTKLMDRAYDIAEAGVNRAAVQLKMDPSLATDNLVTDHLYKSGTPQWPHGNAAGDTEAFEGGTYNVTIWQSERTSPHDETQNPQYKVVRSTGTITSGSMTAQRTIEARIIAGAPNTEYDASFDYCIYNGFNQEGGHGTWPSDQPTWHGSWTWDGYTPYEGRIPKGAIYTQGNINVPCALFGDLNIIGNLVATDNITLRSDWGFSTGSNGISITKGNVVAGLNRDAIGVDGRNTATVAMNLSFGWSSAIQVYGDGVQDKGFIVAANDVNVTNSWALSFFTPPFCLGVKNSTGEVQGGLKAGDNVYIKSDVSLGTIQLGNIVSTGKTYVENNWSTMLINSIKAGRPNDVGVELQASNVGNPGVRITGGITSSGQVLANSSSSRLHLGDVTSGRNSTGSGLQFTASTPSNNSIGIIQTIGTIRIPNLVPPETSGLIPHSVPVNPAPAITTAPAAPDVVSEVLKAADLTAPVPLIEPNWSYYADQAALDDIANGPRTKVCHNCGKTVATTGGSPPQFPANCPYCGANITADPPGRAHVVKDRQAGESPEETGDWGGSNNDGVIRLRWDITKAYSAMETVYSGNANATVRIEDMNWGGINNNKFDGTIVSKGNVKIEAPDQAHWVIGTKNSLNICSNVDISKDSAAGWSFVSNDSSQYHFWAKRNIDLRNFKFSFVGAFTFYGSFTAGNRVYYGDNTWFDNTTFKWSRWPIAAQAWVAPVRVLSWKEL